MEPVRLPAVVRADVAPLPLPRGVQQRHLPLPGLGARGGQVLEHRPAGATDSIISEECYSVKLPNSSAHNRNEIFVITRLFLI